MAGSKLQVENCSGGLCMENDSGKLKIETYSNEI